VGVVTYIGVKAAIIIAAIPIGLTALVGVLGVKKGDLFAILIPNEGGFLSCVLGKGLDCLKAGVSTLGVNASDGASAQIDSVSIHGNYLSFFCALIITYLILFVNP
jgi:hypothetical protein